MRMNPPSQMQTPRIVRALIVSLCAILVFGGVTGLAISDPEDPAIPAQFGLPVRLPDDRALYNLTIYNVTAAGLRESTPTHPAIEFRWTAPRLLPDRNGTLRAGEELVIVDLDDWESSVNGVPVLSPFILAYDLDGTQLYRGSTTAATSSHTRPHNSVGILERWNNTHDQLSRWYSDPDPRRIERSCLAHNLLQGATQTLGAAVRLYDRCSFRLDRFEHADVDEDWAPRGTDRIHGLDALVFETSDAQRGRIQMWLSESVPYPLKVVLEDKSSNPRVAVIEMADFDRGAPRPRPIEPPRTTAFVRHAPLTPWLLDDSDVQHPFPLSEAFAHARDDPDYPKLREFMATHPEGYLRFARLTDHAHHNNSATAGTRPAVTHRYAWTLVMADGPDEFAFEISEHHRGVTDAVLPWGHVGEEVAHSYNGFGFAAPPAPPRSWLPTSLPTVGSLYASWPNHAAQSVGRSPASWGFMVSCGNEECKEPTIELRVGINEDVITDCRRSPACFADGTRSRESRRSELEVGPDLVATEYREWRGLQEGQHGLQPLGNQQTPAANGPAPTQAVAYDPSRARQLWAMPDPAVGAGISIAGLLIGLGYFLWPILKQASWLGLFSRIQRPTALAHPARSQIHLLVQNNPGTHFLEIARHTGLSRGQVEHHLGKLLATGLIVQERTPGFTCYFAAGEVARVQRESAAFLKAESARRILEHVRARPGATLSDAARALGLSVPTVKYHVDRLRSANVLRSEENGGRILLFASAA